MKFDHRLGLRVAGVWFILVAIAGLGIFDVGSISSVILPLIALVAGILLVIK